LRGLKNIQVSIFVLILGIIILTITTIAYSFLLNYHVIPSRGIIKTRSSAYIIYRDASFIFAFNNITHAVEFNSTDAKSVIQYAVDALAAEGGGRILIKNGEYDLSDEILFNQGYSYITLEGESWNTVLKTNNGTYNAIRFRGNVQPNVGCVIRNLKIDGGCNVATEVWDQKNGIMTTGTINSTFENLFITNTGRTGIYNTQGSNGNIIRNNYLYRCHRFGISYTSSNRGIVVNNTAEECGNGITWDSTYGNNWYTIFANNTLIHNEFADIYMLGSEQSPTRYGIFINNTIYTSGQYSVWAQYAYDIIFKNNTIYYDGTGSSVIQVRAGNFIISNNEIHSGTVYESIGVWGEYNIVIDHNLINSSAVRLYWGRNISVKNNFFTKAGVIIGSGCNSTVVASNTLTGIGNDGVYTRIYNNTGYNGPQLEYYVAISPTSSIIECGKFQTFTATIVGGISPYSIEWRINDLPQTEIRNSLIVNAFSVGTYIVSIKVTDAQGTTTFETAILYARWI
jgi:parallel beta-helix repeat protein